MVVEAPTSDKAVEVAIAEFVAAAKRAGLPDWPVARVETIADDDELEEEG